MVRQAGRGDTGILATMEFSLHPYLLMGRSDNEMSGSAIIIDGLAITTFDSNVLPISQLPNLNAREITLPGYPIKILIYHNSITKNDIRMTLLGGLLLAGLVGILAYYILITKKKC